jgi:hypothetical protein
MPHAGAHSRDENYEHIGRQQRPDGTFLALFDGETPRSRLVLERRVT